MVLAAGWLNFPQNEQIGQNEHMGQNVVRKHPVVMAGAIALAASIPVAGGSDPLITTQTNNFGTPGGLIDMPTAEQAPVGQMSATVSGYAFGKNAQTTRTQLTFQPLPRLSATFRYSGIGGLVPTPGRPAFDTLFDRSFDLRFRVLNESTWRPAVAIGLQDFIGTGIYSGEYVVATKSLGDRIRVSGGIGWGRLGSYSSFGSTGSRPNTTLGQGGIPTYDRWFRGDMSAFGGVSFQATDKLSFAAEYSSDAYDREVQDGNITRKSPWNFGVTYKASETLQLSAYSLYGDEIGLNATLSFNALKPAVRGGGEQAPLPVAPRAPGAAADLGWTTDAQRPAAAIGTLSTLLEREGIKIHGFQLGPQEAHIQIRNLRYDMRAQAVGRTARAMTRALPASIELFTITQMVQGQPSSSVTLRRSDIERLENAPATEILAAATFRDGTETDRAITLMPEIYPRFEYGLAPFLRFSVFDPENPVRFNAGIRAKAKYHIAPGWVASGSVSQKLFGDLDSVALPGPSGLPRVRSNVAFYNQTDEPTIDHLTIANYGRPGKDLYSRVTLGYLERMYAGASAEVLWKPVESRFALGAEVNYVAPRDFDQQFGLRTRSTTGGTIPEWNGHLSAYYDIGYGFHGQVDAGRYLAGDWGATLSLDRVFANGWSVGAYATKTNVSSATFGEGSFDKGIKIVIPFSWGTGSPTLQESTTVLKSLSRDGGARLEVEGRLYEQIKDTHRTEMAKSWGKFWR